MVSTHEPGQTRRSWDGEERRRARERRSTDERRHDPRAAETPQRRSIIGSIRTVLNPRIGIDRRKGRERRKTQRTRTLQTSTIVTPEELQDLLG